MTTDKTIPDRYKGILLIIASAFCFAFMNAFVRLAGDLPAIEKSFFRNFVAVFFALGILLKKRTPLPQTKGDYGYLFLRASTGTLGVKGIPDPVSGRGCLRSICRMPVYPPSFPPQRRVYPCMYRTDGRYLRRFCLHHGPQAGKPRGCRSFYCFLLFRIFLYRDTAISCSPLCAYERHPAVMPAGRRTGRHRRTVHHHCGVLLCPGKRNLCI